MPLPSSALGTSILFHCYYYCHLTMCSVCPDRKKWLSWKHVTTLSTKRHCIYFTFELWRLGHPKISWRVSYWHVGMHATLIPAGIPTHNITVFCYLCVLLRVHLSCRVRSDAGPGLLLSSGYRCGGECDRLFASHSTRTYERPYRRQIL